MSGEESAHRVSLLADDRRYDLVAPANAQVGDLLAVLGIAPRNSPYAVATPAGRVIALHEVLADVVPEGALLTVVRATTHEVPRDVRNLDPSVVSAGARSPEGQGGRYVPPSEATIARSQLSEVTRRRGDLPTDAAAPDPAATGVAVVVPAPAAASATWLQAQVLTRWAAGGIAAAAALVLGLGAFRGQLPSGTSWPAVAALLLFVPGLALALDASATGRLSRVVAPVFGFAAGLALPVTDSPSSGRIAVLAGCVLATALAGVSRIVGGPSDRASRAAMTAFAAVGSLCVVGVLLDWPSFAVAAVVAGLVPTVVRLLPSLGFDLPDEQLVDVDRLATTIWTARVQQVRRFRRLRPREVDGVFLEARETVAAGTVWGCLVAAVALTVLVVTPGRSALATWGAVGLCAAVTFALGYQSRTVRDRLPRTAMLTTAGVAALLGTYAAGARLADSWGFLLLALATLLGLVAVGSAVALARGWHSTRLSRLADLLESFAVVLSLPLAAVAADGIEAFRRLTSG
ncbi:hypothetical protein RKE38_01570 [Phycicoccus sp. M110.8]|uniref:hypothetical protein n=1 Tax=Phycicoccus sp. M110.8 TaxID=3075433 RepID=UPI0028FD9A77|nr:hypothetical protein [Phycicoccus sp. M110.8]MDU0312359.1 hypothetical protein [Phycicoccus sp. M110.8]